MRGLIVVFIVAMLAMLPAVCVAGTCADGVCPLGGPAYTIPNAIEATVSGVVQHPLVAAAQRSVGIAGKALAAPVRAIGRIAKAIRERERKPVMRAVALAGRGGARLICHRAASRRG